VAGGRLINRVLAPLDWFYPSAKAMYMWRMGRTYNRYDHGPVLVLQMGKVGSKSVQAGLEAQVLDRPIYHAHFLSRERTARTEKQRRKFFRTDRHSYLMRPWLNQFLLQTFEEHKDKHTWKLITLTREPVGRNISAFFENLEVVPCKADGEFEISSDYYQIQPTIVSVDDTDTLAQLFFERAQHDSPLRFFDREIRDIFEIDVLGSGFPIEKGYGIYSSERADLLVLKLESLAHCADAALAEFLDIDEFRVINRNIGAKKVYAPLYDAFKRNANIDSEYADTLYNSEYMRTFYSDAEIAAARANWLRNEDT
jgi:hypothetical protein